MITLGIETSCEIGSIALLEDNKILASRSHSAEHGSLLIPSIKEVLEENGLLPKDLNLIAIDMGPGSYTGIRIGVVTAKTLAWSFKTDLIGISSLDIIAENASVESSKVCPVLDAKLGQIYGAVYERKEGVLKKTTDYFVVSCKEILEMIPEGSLILGDAIKRYKDIFEQKKDAMLADATLWQPLASVVARLGRERFLKGVKDDYKELSPLYLRPSYAEMKKSKIKQ